MLKKYLLATVVVMAVWGCSGNSVTRTKLLDVTIGQQLIDLKKARDVGALSASEYADQRTMLIRSAE